MKLKDFTIGKTFWMSGKQYRTTDVGTRTVVAICINDHYCPRNYSNLIRGRKDQKSFFSVRTINRWRKQAEHNRKSGWFNGPPYAVVEQVIDENDLDACYSRPPNWYLVGWCAKAR